MACARGQEPSTLPCSASSSSSACAWHLPSQGLAQQAASPSLPSCARSSACRDAPPGIFCTCAQPQGPWDPTRAPGRPATRGQEDLRGRKPNGHLPLPNWPQALPQQGSSPPPALRPRRLCTAKLFPVPVLPQQLPLPLSCQCHPARPRDPPRQGGGCGKSPGQPKEDSKPPPTCQLGSARRK